MNIPTRGADPSGVDHHAPSLASLASASLWLTAAEDARQRLGERRLRLPARPSAARGHIEDFVSAYGPAGRERLADALRRRLVEALLGGGG